MISEVQVVNIGITTRCNFTCGFCWGRHLPQGDLSLEQFEQLLAALPNATYVDLTGEGEPLLNPHFFDMVRKARARGLRVGFYTNGSLLSRIDLDALLDAGIESLTVSLESTNPKKFADIRGGSFDLVRQGLQKLIRRRMERGLLLPTVQLAVTLLTDTVDSFPDIVAFYRDLGLDGGIDVQALNSNAGYAQWYGPALRGQLLDPALAAKCFDEAAHLPEARRTGPGLDFGEALAEALGADAGRGCPWLERGLFVRHDGLVSPCCVLKDERDAFGRIGENGWPAIRQARSAMRDTLRRGEIPTCCAECDVAKNVARTVAAKRRSELEQLGTEVRRLEAEIAVREGEARRLSDEIRALRTSVSWRVGAPARAGIDRLRGL